MSQSFTFMPLMVEVVPDGTVKPCPTATFVDPSGKVWIYKLASELPPKKEEEVVSAAMDTGSVVSTTSTRAQSPEADKKSTSWAMTVAKTSPPPLFSELMTLAPKAPKKKSTLVDKDTFMKKIKERMEHMLREKDKKVRIKWMLGDRPIMFDNKTPESYPLSILTADGDSPVYAVVGARPRAVPDEDDPANHTILIQVNWLTAAVMKCEEQQLQFCYTHRNEDSSTVECYKMVGVVQFDDMELENY
jgi:hypothetical protein